MARRSTKTTPVIYGHWEGDLYYCAPTAYEQARIDAASAKSQKIRRSRKKPADPRTWIEAEIDGLRLAIRMAKASGDLYHVMKFSQETERLQRGNLERAA